MFTHNSVQTSKLELNNKSQKHRLHLQWKIWKNFTEFLFHFENVDMFGIND